MEAAVTSLQHFELDLGALRAVTDSTFTLSDRRAFNYLAQTDEAALPLFRPVAGPSNRHSVAHARTDLAIEAALAASGVRTVSGSRNIVLVAPSPKLLTLVSREMHKTTYASTPTIVVLFWRETFPGDAQRENFDHVAPMLHHMLQRRITGDAIVVLDGHPVNIHVDYFDDANRSCSSRYTYCTCFMHTIVRLNPTSLILPHCVYYIDWAHLIAAASCLDCATVAILDVPPEVAVCAAASTVGKLRRDMYPHLSSDDKEGYHINITEEHVRYYPSNDGRPEGTPYVTTLKQYSRLAGHPGGLRCSARREVVIGITQLLILTPRTEPQPASLDTCHYMAPTPHTRYMPGKYRIGVILTEAEFRNYSRPLPAGASANELLQSVRTRIATTGLYSDNRMHTVDTTTAMVIAAGHTAVNSRAIGYVQRANNPMRSALPEFLYVLGNRCKYSILECWDRVAPWRRDGEILEEWQTEFYRDSATSREAMGPQRLHLQFDTDNRKFRVEYKRPMPYVNVSPGCGDAVCDAMHIERLTGLDTYDAYFAARPSHCAVRIHVETYISADGTEILGFTKDYGVPYRKCLNQSVIIFQCLSGLPDAASLVEGITVRAPTSVHVSGIVTSHGECRCGQRNVQFKGRDLVESRPTRVHILPKADVFSEMSGGETALAPECHRHLREYLARMYQKHKIAPDACFYFGELGSGRIPTPTATLKRSGFTHFAHSDQVNFYVQEVMELEFPVRRVGEGVVLTRGELEPYGCYEQGRRRLSPLWTSVPPRDLRPDLRSKAVSDFQSDYLATKGLPGTTKFLYGPQDHSPEIRFDAPGSYVEVRRIGVRLTVLERPQDGEGDERADEQPATPQFGGGAGPDPTTTTSPPQLEEQAPAAGGAEAAAQRSAGVLASLDESPGDEYGEDAPLLGVRAPGGPRSVMRLLDACFGSPPRRASRVGGAEEGEEIELLELTDVLNNPAEPDSGVLLGYLQEEEVGSPELSSVPPEAQGHAAGGGGRDPRRRAGGMSRLDLQRHAPSAVNFQTRTPPAQIGRHEGASEEVGLQALSHGDGWKGASGPSGHSPQTELPSQEGLQGADFDAGALELACSGLLEAARRLDASLGATQDSVALPPANSAAEESLEGLRAVLVDRFADSPGEGEPTQASPGSEGASSHDGVTYWSMAGALDKAAQEALDAYFEPLSWDTACKRRRLFYGFKWKDHSSPLTPAPPVPSILGELVDSVSSHIELPGGQKGSEYFNQVIINKYGPGDELSPHIDDVRFGDVILSIATGCCMDFTFHDDPPLTVTSGDGSLLAFRGRHRWSLKHSVRRGLHALGVRTSYTFRHLPPQHQPPVTPRLKAPLRQPPVHRGEASGHVEAPETPAEARTYTRTTSSEEMPFSGQAKLMLLLAGFRIARQQVERCLYIGCSPGVGTLEWLKRDPNLTVHGYDPRAMYAKHERFKVSQVSVDQAWLDDHLSAVGPGYYAFAICDAYEGQTVVTLDFRGLPSMHKERATHNPNDCYRPPFSKKGEWYRLASARFGEDVCDSLGGIALGEVRQSVLAAVENYNELCDPEGTDGAKQLMREVAMMVSRSEGALVAHDGWRVAEYEHNAVNKRRIDDTCGSQKGRPEALHELAVGSKLTYEFFSIDGNAGSGKSFHIFNKPGGSKRDFARKNLYILCETNAVLDDWKRNLPPACLSKDQVGTYGSVLPRLLVRAPRHLCLIADEVMQHGFATLMVELAHLHRKHNFASVVILMVTTSNQMPAMRFLVTPQNPKKHKDLEMPEPSVYLPISFRFDAAWSAYVAMFREKRDQRPVYGKGEPQDATSPPVFMSYTTAADLARRLKSLEGYGSNYARVGATTKCAQELGAVLSNVGWPSEPEPVSAFNAQGTQATLLHVHISSSCKVLGEDLIRLSVAFTRWRTGPASRILVTHQAGLNLKVFKGTAQRESDILRNFNVKRLARRGESHMNCLSEAAVEGAPRSPGRQGPKLGLSSMKPGSGPLSASYKPNEEVRDPSAAIPDIGQNESSVIDVVERGARYVVTSKARVKQGYSSNTHDLYHQTGVSTSVAGVRKAHEYVPCANRFRVPPTQETVLFDLDLALSLLTPARMPDLTVMAQQPAMREYKAGVAKLAAVGERPRVKTPKVEDSLVESKRAARLAGDHPLAIYDQSNHSAFILQTLVARGGTHTYQQRRARGDKGPEGVPVDYVSDVTLELFGGLVGRHIVEHYSRPVKLTPSTMRDLVEYAHGCIMLKLAQKHYPGVVPSALTVAELARLDLRGADAILEAHPDALLSSVVSGEVQHAELRRTYDVERVAHDTIQASVKTQQKFKSGPGQGVLAHDPTYTAAHLVERIASRVIILVLAQATAEFVIDPSVGGASLEDSVQDYVRRANQGGGVVDYDSDLSACDNSFSRAFNAQLEERLAFCPEEYKRLFMNLINKILAEHLVTNAKTGYKARIEAINTSGNSLTLAANCATSLMALVTRVDFIVEVSPREAEEGEMRVGELIVRRLPPGVVVAAIVGDDAAASLRRELRPQGKFQKSLYNLKENHFPAGTASGVWCNVLFNTRTCETSWDMERVLTKMVGRAFPIPVQGTLVAARLLAWRNQTAGISGETVIHAARLLAQRKKRPRAQDYARCEAIVSQAVACSRLSATAYASLLKAFTMHMPDVQLS